MDAHMVGVFYQNQIGRVVVPMVPVQMMDVKAFCELVE
jgi:hypothetical protein